MKKKSILTLIIISLYMFTSCNGQQTIEEGNPLLEEWTTPYGLPPFAEILPEHYGQALEVAMDRHVAEIDSIVTNPAAATFENTILALDRSGGLLDKVYNTFSLVAMADTNDELMAIEAHYTPLIAQHGDKIMMNQQLFERVRSVYAKRRSLGLDSLALRLTEQTYNKFVRAGANLSAEQQRELAEINSELSVATLAFSNNLLAENSDYRLVLDANQLGGIPVSVRNAAKAVAREMGMDDKWVFTLDKPSMLPFLTYADNDTLRQQIYTAYISKGANGNEHDNRALIARIARLRARRAALLGYPTHAHYVLADQMAATPANVNSLLSDLWEPALAQAAHELEVMRAIRKREKDSDEFNAWDWWFYAEKVRKQRYNLEDEELRPYFAVDNVRAGIFWLANRLYGITFTPLSAEGYNPECSTFRVSDVDGSHLGVLILDLYPRAGKQSGAWCGDFVGQSYDEEGNRVAPVVNIVANFTRPNGNTPALLSLDEVSTYFHEFGHALQSILSDVPYKGLRDLKRDFVELPSQIMENWAVRPEMLRNYAIHYSSGAVIPDNLIRRIERSAIFNQGFNFTELLAASITDMRIHSLRAEEIGEDFDASAFEQEVLSDLGLIDEIAPRYHFPYFSHIFGGGFEYSAGYYSYTWAEVLDKDAFRAFVETGDIFDKATAARFRTLLSAGGERDGMELYREFRGAEPSRMPLLVARGLAEEEPEPEEDEGPEVVELISMETGKPMVLNMRNGARRGDVDPSERRPASRATRISRASASDLTEEEARGDVRTTRDPNNPRVIMPRANNGE